LADYKEFYKKGILLKYFPDDKVILLSPNKSSKDDFLHFKSSLDTLLQITGTKRVGNNFTMKLDDNANVNIDELLKSLGMKGGIEREDMQSAVADEAEDAVKEEEKEQKAVPQNSSGDLPKLESISVKSFLINENGPFSLPQGKKQRSKKRYGGYWKSLEAFSGKNRNAIMKDDVLEMRRKFAIKPASSDRDTMLRALDKAENYFFLKLKKIAGEDAALEFHQEYISLDNLDPEDYEDGDEEHKQIDSPEASVTLPSIDLGAFDDIDYSDINIEDE
jgi:hypothetical protein